MKGLSIEQKAKRYDEALERAKKWYNAPNIDKMPTYGNRVIEEIFPELKESEDERIKEAIITTIHLYYGEPLEDEAKEMIAWLEKQELKSNPYSGVSFSYNDNIWGMCARDNGVDILFNKKLIQHISGEKQGEQKPTIEMKSAEENLGIDSETYNKIVDECIYGEQKPQRIISAEAKEALYDKPDWSKKDENVLEDIEEAIIYYWHGDMQDILLDWLKSLRPQNTWKPSIAQLNALSIVSKGNAPDDIEAIVSLYNDLKKLTE